VQVAVAGVGVVERAVHVEVHMVAVGNGRVTRRRVLDAALDRRAGSRPPPVHVEAMLVGVALVRSVQVPVVQVVGVVAVLHGLVAAAFAVPMLVLAVLIAAHLCILALRERAVNRGIIVQMQLDCMKILAGLSVLAFTPAAQAAPAAEAAGARPVAAATIAPLASLAAQVAGKGWDVATIVPPGVSPHVFEPGPRDVKRLAKARLVVTVGAGYDLWAARIVAACAAQAVVHDAGASVGVRADEGPAGERDHDGEIGRDPHWYLSPRRAAAALGPLAEAFARLDPSGAAGYRARAAEGARALATLDAEIAAALAPVRGRTVVSTHNSWTYFLADYGLVNGGSVEPAPGREPSPHELRALIDLVREKRIPALFTEPQFPPSAARVVAEDAGVRLVLADPQGGVPGRETYADLLRFDARAFREGLR
jgi:ABC-type Zn uptake system ZnuABC Zn-binding protein ZnuA